MPEFGIAFGSNLGDRLAAFRDALAQVRRGLDPEAAVECSPVYATAPVGCAPGAPGFYNAVVVVECPATPRAMLELLRDTESALGRAPAGSRPRNADRSIDLDLLYAGDATIDSADLTVPHPRLHLRRFVLRPLCDLRPALVLPGQKFTVSQLLARLQSDEPAPAVVAEGWGGAEP